MIRGGKKYKLTLLLIVGVALLLRTYRLSSLPVSLSMDEVTFGYASYSVLKTGMDEYGRILPLYFQGMGDFKPPVDVYLKIPFIYALGLTETAVRLPGAILGSLTALGVAILLKRLTQSAIVPLFGGGWVAVSPWHVFYSRAGYEAITALFFLVFGITFFLVWVDEKRIKHLGWSLVFFSLAVWSYHAERVFVPLLFIGLVLVYRKTFRELLKSSRQTVNLFIIFSVFAVPFVIVLLTTGGVSARAQELWVGKEIAIGEHPYGFLRALAGQYLGYFDLRLWFWRAVGITPRGYLDIGLMAAADGLVLAMGAVAIVKSGMVNVKNVKKVGLLFLILGPIPAAFARGEPSAIRILVWIPLIALILGVGFEKLVENKWWKAVAGYAVFQIIYFLYFWNMYSNNFSKYYADLWHYGYKEVAQDVCEMYGKYEKIVVTDKYGIEIPKVKTVPHYYILFHCQYDPAQYLAVRDLYNVEIRQPQWQEDSKIKGELLIGSPWDFPSELDESRIIKRINFPGNKPAFYYVETDD